MVRCEVRARTSSHPLSRSCRVKFPVQDDAHAVALRVGFARDVHREVDGAHDAVTEFLVNEFLDGAAIDTHQFVEAIDEGIGWHGRGQRALVGDDLQQVHRLVGQVEHRPDLFGLLSGQCHLAQQGGGCPLLALAGGLGELRPL